MTNDCAREYSFEVPVSVSPEKDTFHVGDTLWIEVIVGNEMLDKIANQPVDLSVLQLKLDLYAIAYQDNAGQTTISDFSTINNIGTLVPSMFFYHMFFDDSANQRIIKFGLIAKKSSLYSLGFDYLRADYEDHNLMKNKCNDLIKWSFTTNEHRDSLGYYQIPAYIRDAVSMKEHLRSGNFVFRVVD